MRFIISEQPHEKLLAAGQLRYVRDGRPTGTVEAWRLTAVAAGYRFLRVDLDARDARSGHTYLYHLVLNEDGRPERLKFRFWGDIAGQPLQVSGDVVLEAEAASATRTVNEETADQVLSLPPAHGFWFPCSMGLAMLAQQAPAESLAAVSMNTDLEQPRNLFSLSLVTVSHVVADDGAHVLRWADQERRLRLDDGGWTARMERDDGLAAEAERTVYYQDQ